MESTEARLVRLEVQQTQLTDATKENTAAIKGLTTTLTDLVNAMSYSKGAFWGAFKIASAGTAIVGGIGAIILWFMQMLHLGKI